MTASVLSNREWLPRVDLFHPAGRRIHEHHRVTQSFRLPSKNAAVDELTQIVPRNHRSVFKMKHEGSKMSQNSANLNSDAPSVFPLSYKNLWGTDPCIRAC